MEIGALFWSLTDTVNSDQQKCLSISHEPVAFYTLNEWRALVSIPSWILLLLFAASVDKFVFGVSLTVSSVQCHVPYTVAYHHSMCTYAGSNQFITEAYSHCSQLPFVQQAKFFCQNFKAPIKLHAVILLIERQPTPAILYRWGQGEQMHLNSARTTSLYIKATVSRWHNIVEGVFEQCIEWCFLCQSLLFWEYARCLVSNVLVRLVRISAPMPTSATEWSLKIAILM